MPAEIAMININLRLPLLLLMLLLLHLLWDAPLAVATLTQCSNQPGGKVQCRVTGPLTDACPPNATSLILGFSSIDNSWSADAGLTNCLTVTHLKVTGWSGPELASGHLAQLGRLTVAEFFDCGLESVGARVSTDHLSKLTLARNKISSVHERALEDCASLLTLDLGENLIEHLASRLLSNCRSLRSLRLTGNRLAELQSDALLGAVDLREIFLQRNRVKRLSQVELAFSNSKRVTLIDLRDNELLWYSAGKLGFCGPTNVTVRMHFAGCPPSATAAARSGGLYDGADRVVPDKSEGQCVGSSARLIVTFTNCQIDLTAARRSIQCPPTTTAGTPESEITRSAQDFPPATTDSRWLLNGLATIAQEATWPLYALAGTVLFALMQLLVSLAVCHRLKLRNARLQVRVDRLVEVCPSHRCYQHPTLCSHSALSGRLTPSGKGPSSQFGYSQCEVDASTTPPSMRTTSPPPPPPPLLPPSSMMPLTFSRNSAGPPAGGSDFGAEQPLRLVEDESES